MCTITNHLAGKVPGEKDIPGGQVPVEKVLAGEIVHTVSHLSAEGEELCW